MKITITGENEPPTANDDTAATDANKISDGASRGQSLANDTDPDVFDAITVSKVNGVDGQRRHADHAGLGCAVDRQQQRQLHLQSQRQVRLARRRARPPPISSRTTSPTAAGEEDDAKVTINVTGANEAPNVENQTFSIAENSASRHAGGHGRRRPIRTPAPR